MLLQIHCANMSPVPRHISQHGNPHCRFLEIGQVPIPGRICLCLFFVNTRDPGRIARYDFILLVPMPDKPCSPPITIFFKEEDEATVGFNVKLNAINHESLSDRSLEFSHGASSIRGDIRRAAMTPVHDERSVIHAGLRGLDEIGGKNYARPGRADIRTRVKDGLEIIPLACIPSSQSVRTSPQESVRLEVGLTYNKASPQRAHGA